MVIIFIIFSILFKPQGYIFYFHTIQTYACWNNYHTARE